MLLTRRVAAFSLIILLVSSFGLSACGTKGALYIPEQRYPQDLKSDSAK